MNNVLDLPRIDHTSEIGRLEIEMILGVEGVRAPVIQWVIDSLIKWKQSEDNLRGKIEDLEVEVEDLQRDARV